MPKEAEKVTETSNHEYLLIADWFPPKQLQSVIDGLVDHGREILGQTGYPEGRVKVLLFKPRTPKIPNCYDAAVSILIPNRFNSVPLRRPLRFRKPDSPVRALQQFGVDFGAADQGIIVKSSTGSQELADQNEVTQSADDLIYCLYNYQALVTVETKGQLKKRWVELPQGRKLLQSLDGRNLL